MSNKNDYNDSKVWLFKIFIMTFSLSLIFNYLSTEVVEEANIIVSIIILIAVILIGIMFDLIATAATAADEVPFHAKAADKKKGAKQSVKLVKNADKVSSFCADVIGDICGILSGATSALISVNISNLLHLENIIVVTMLVTAFATSLTVFGKAVGKHMAIAKANDIIDFIGKFLAFFSK